jgi:hypothetical protein
MLYQTRDHVLRRSMSVSEMVIQLSKAEHQAASSRKRDQTKPRLLRSLTRATSTQVERARRPYRSGPDHNSDNDGLHQRRVERKVLLRAPARAPYWRCRCEPGERAAEHEQAEPQFGGCDRRTTYFLTTAREFDADFNTIGR